MSPDADAPVVRPARDEERPAARAVVDRAMLRVPDPGDPQWLVAVEDGRVVGSLALRGAGSAPDASGKRSDPRAEIEAIAVRRGRRGEGIGRALVEAAAERHGSLTAEFREGVRAFYEALGFEVEEHGDRLRGTLAVR